MRHTSFRRRSGLRITGDMSRLGGDRAQGGTQARDLTIPDDDPDGIVCVVCGARVAILATGRPRSHAAGGVMTNTRKGNYKCEGSGLA